jgi:hypothetical protein
MLKDHQIRIPEESLKVMMTDCKKLYLDNYPNRRGCKISIGEMFTEVVTFYRDAEGFINRRKK